MSQGFSGDRYWPPAGGPQADQATVTQLPARPLVQVDYAAVVAGKLRSTFGPPPPSRAWLVRRITVQNTAPGRAYVYVGDELPENVVSGTRSGTFDENDPRQPIFVPESTRLLVVWQGAITGGALARIEYVEV